MSFVCSLICWNKSFHNPEYEQAEAQLSKMMIKKEHLILLNCHIITDIQDIIHQGMVFYKLCLKKIKL